MALIECGECKESVSSEAESCPKCGAPIKPKAKQYGCGTLILALVIIGVFASMFGGKPTPAPPAPMAPKAAPPTAAERKKAEATQAERLQFIQKLIAQGVFTKVDVPGSLPRAYTGRQFEAATFDQKAQFVSVVYAYYSTLDPSKYDMVAVYDGFTGKKRGTFTKDRGLVLDD